MHRNMHLTDTFPNSVSVLCPLNLILKTQKKEKKLLKVLGLSATLTAVGVVKDVFWEATASSPVTT